MCKNTFVDRAALYSQNGIVHTNVTQIQLYLDTYIARFACSFYSFMCTSFLRFSCNIIFINVDTLEMKNKINENNRETAFCNIQKHFENFERDPSSSPKEYKGGLHNKSHHHFKVCGHLPRFVPEVAISWNSVFYPAFRKLLSL